MWASSVSAPGEDIHHTAIATAPVIGRGQGVNLPAPADTHGGLIGAVVLGTALLAKGQQPVAYGVDAGAGAALHTEPPKRQLPDFEGRLAAGPVAGAARTWRPAVGLGDGFVAALPEGHLDRRVVVAWCGSGTIATDTATASSPLVVVVVVAVVAAVRVGLVQHVDDPPVTVARVRPAPHPLLHPGEAVPVAVAVVVVAATAIQASVREATHSHAQCPPARERLLLQHPPARKAAQPPWLLRRRRLDLGPEHKRHPFLGRERACHCEHGPRRS